jgi:CheY-like chemotaxis protein/signal transduction histidine kinase/CHASE3 domain sensor protein
MAQTVDQATFKKLLIRNISLPLLLGLVSCVTFVAVILFLIETKKNIEADDLAIGRAYQIEKLMLDAETGLRGFIITGNETFLEPTERATNMLPERFTSLQKLVAAYPEQVGRLGAIREAFNNWLLYSDRTIEQRRSNKLKAEQIVAAGRGKQLMDNIRQLTTQFIETQEGLRSEKNKSAGDTTNYVLGAVIALSLLSGIFIALMGRNQLVELSKSYEGTLAEQLKQNAILENRQWIDNGRNQLSERMLGELRVADVAQQALSYLAESLGAKVGAFYVANEQQKFECYAAIGVSEKSTVHENQFQMGVGLLGETARSNKVTVLDNLPVDYLKVETTFGSMAPQHVMVIPFSTHGRVNALAELALLNPADEKALQFLADSSGSVSVAVRSAIYRDKLEKLYSELQNQAEELQAQQEELRVSNEELEEQTKLLKEAQVRLESQHAELEQTNAQLEDQAQILETQKQAVSQQNNQLKQARFELEHKANELVRSSQYKSEFLANMSHELRTPLNSSLILAKLLADNKDRNLTAKQVEFAKQIISSGNDLLNLINDVLDLSKVESGKLDIHPERLPVNQIAQSLENIFKPIAEEKKLAFKIHLEPDIPETVFTDKMRVEQILKNLLSNAMKFTAAGSVNLSITRVDAANIKFSVRDTGVGIAKDQQEVIFEAFRQADGTANRKYGGTGLGLSISKDLAALLGGEIQVQSVPGSGSEFSLILPNEYTPVSAEDVESKSGRRSLTANQTPSATAATVNTSYETPTLHHEKRQKKLSAGSVPDDREVVNNQDRVVLITEDDTIFAQILLDLARELKFKAVVASTAEQAIDLVSRFNFSAILLDINLPDHSGLFILDHLKSNAKTRHIPVHIISGEDLSHQALQMGAVGFLLKPVERDDLSTAFMKLETQMNHHIKKVLVVEDDEVQRQAICQLIEDSQISTTAVALGTDALAKLATETFDCVIMDLTLPDMTGFSLLEQMAEHEAYAHPPVIVYTGKDLSRDEEARLRKHSQSLIIKGASSPDRLFSEVTLFLHKVESNLAPERQQMLEVLRNREKAFDAKTILMVDDDIRNVFALTAALEQRGAKVVIARDGKEALKKLDEENGIDLVLMDIMMPVMNGYEAMEEIRKQSRFTKLPIIALTAKAMKDDRDLCIKAGANDYLSKPVDVDKLLSLIRIWMSKGEGKRNGLA